MPIFRNGGSYGDQVRNVASTSVVSVGGASQTIAPVANQKYIRLAPINPGNYYFAFTSNPSTTTAEKFRSAVTILTNTAVYIVGTGPASVSAASSAGLVTEGSDTINITAHGLSTGDIIKYSSTTTAIGGLTSGNTYYVVGASANAFQLALTSGGAAIDLTNDGVGTHTFNTMRDVYIEQGI